MLSKFGTLYEMCLQFVSDNIYCVQSLEGFPEQIGEQIMRRTLQSDVFSSTDQTVVHRICCLFSEAYPDAVLVTANLKNDLLTINMFTESLTKLLRHVRELDLKGCKLGDDHELLQAIANFERLEMLSLADNSLTDKGIRVLTLPMRMFERGPTGLQMLNLSENCKITDKSVPWLLSYQRLKLLCVMGTTISEQGKKQLIQNNFEETADKMREIVSSGWASGVLKDWNQTCKDKQKQAKCRRQQSAIANQNFYRKRSPFVSRKIETEIKTSCEKLTWLKRKFQSYETCLSSAKRKRIF